MGRVAVLRDIVAVIDYGGVLGWVVAVALNVGIGLIGHQDVVYLGWRLTLFLPISLVELLAHIPQLIFTLFPSKYLHI